MCCSSILYTYKYKGTIAHLSLEGEKGLVK